MKSLKSISGKKSQTLPENGWIKPCIYCGSPTFKTYKYFYEGDVYNCYFCKNCLGKNKRIERFNKYILINIFNNT